MTVLAWLYFLYNSKLHSKSAAQNPNQLGEHSCHHLTSTTSFLLGLYLPLSILTSWNPAKNRYQYLITYPKAWCSHGLDSKCLLCHKDQTIRWDILNINICPVPDEICPIPLYAWFGLWATLLGQDPFLYFSSILASSLPCWVPAWLTYEFDLKGRAK